MKDSPERASGDLLNLSLPHFEVPSSDRLSGVKPSTHKPRILLLYGSLRERSFSRFLTFETSRLLEALGAEPRVYDPRDLPLPDGAPDTHPKVRELRELAAGVVLA